MTRDYSNFLPSKGTTPTQAAPSRLDALGWQAFFASQIDLDTLETTPPCRVTEVHRSGLRVMGEATDATVPPSVEATVGDWLLYDAVQPHDSQVLERKSLLQRRAPGHDRRYQLIAANIDTAFIVTSCNADFNVARLERYIALAFDAAIDPVVLLTKADLIEDATPYLEQARAISDLVPVIALDARAQEPTEKLAPWCKSGRTVAFLGSSGVGKSTLTNALIGDAKVETQAIREDDARGRHTTRHRHLHVNPGSCAVLDTPGMRELQLTDVAAAVDEVFTDLAELATGCKFRNCEHQSEPGCAVRAALERGEIDPERLTRWRKLAAEDAHNTATLAQRRSKDKQFGKMIKQVKARKPKGP